MLRRLKSIWIGLGLICFLALFSACAWGGTGAVFKVGEARYTIDGTSYPMDAAPYIENGRVFVPFRYAATAVGIAPQDIEWNNSTRTLTLFKAGRVVQVKVGSNVLLVNGVELSMDAPAEIKNGRLYLPIRWLATALGVEVHWEPATATVIVGDSNPSASRVSTSSSGQNTDLLFKEYRWRDHQGQEWTWRVSFPSALYQYYRAQPRLFEQAKEEKLAQLRAAREEIDYWYRQCQVSSDQAFWQAYSNFISARERYEQILRELYSLKLDESLNLGYVTDPENRRLVRRLAQELAAKAPTDPEGRVEFIAAFVQGAIPYVMDKGNYPKYPVETLVEGGVCIDKSILFAALLRELGYRVALLVFEGNPGHMAVGVDCPGAWGSYYLKDGVRYFYLETTAPGWSLGDIPPAHRNQGAIVIPVP
ncbi:stalk domain-containing protein [Desulfothermobacter acidiphilus]|uniref:stalk domain-containing protein n=1 Tax=Desulfothermobacter acidiphilus TaxID=1938353 RepID=UPI003F88E731